MMIHIEGMGVLGSLLALRLEHEGYKFTWNDNNADITAWQACTGAIYPAGKAGSDDDYGYHQWAKALTEKNTWLPANARKYFEECEYTFNHARPPHSGRYKTVPVGNHLRAASWPSYHVNAQQLVPWVRKRFNSLERQVQTPGSRLVIAHGWSSQRQASYWGWTRLVKLGYNQKLFGETRPAFYFRNGAYVMAYAYPVPNTPWWYAGSALIKQRLGRERELLMQDKFERWEKNFKELGHNVARVVEAGDYIQGWRPSMAEPSLKVTPKMIMMPSLWHSGVRHAPVWIDKVVEKIDAYHR